MKEAMMRRLFHDLSFRAKMGVRANRIHRMGE